MTSSGQPRTLFIFSFIVLLLMLTACQQPTQSLETIEIEIQPTQNPTNITNNQNDTNKTNTTQILADSKGNSFFTWET